jgi:hypothetical protein
MIIMIYLHMPIHCVSASSRSTSIVLIIIIIIIVTVTKKLFSIYKVLL